MYKDIQVRTGGGICTGVVGPVRTDKSIFIKRLMELLVLPIMEGENLRSLSRDEPPQSVAGKTIVTMGSKFTLKEAARIDLTGDIETKAGVIDRAGFMVDGVTDHVENGRERLMEIPWFGHSIPSTQAAGIGTRKVINGRSTIGIVATTDGIIEGIKRPGYITAEKQTINKLKKLREPFAVLLNSTKPYSDETVKPAKEMSGSYGVSVPPVNCGRFKKENISHILEHVLRGFPVTEMNFHIPKWLEILSSTHWLKAQVIQAARNAIWRVTHTRDVSGKLEQQHADTVRSMNVKNMQTTDDRAGVQMDTGDSYYYQILSDHVRLPVEGEYQLMQTLSSLADMRKEYGKARNTLTQVWLKGYGMVTPEHSEIVLDKPQVTRHNNRYGAKMKAEAPSINLIKAYIGTEIAPTVGNEQQAQDLIAYIKENTGESDDGIWDINIPGKSIKQIVEDGIQAKMSQMTEDCQLKLQDTL